MALTWQKGVGAERGSYGEWEAAQWSHPGFEPVWPVFLERTSVTTPDHLNEVLTHADLLLPKFEDDWLRRLRVRLGTSREELGPVRTVVYVAETKFASLPSAWCIRHVGPPLPPGALPLQVPEQPPIELPDIGVVSGPPIIAVIDDSIGYLNRRFRVADRTRIKLTWQQGTEYLIGEDIIGIGRVLLGADINRLIREGRDEAEVYAKDSADLSSIIHPQLMRQRASHGTAVLDLAAGGAPGDEDWEQMQEMSILAVQLPSFAMTDTSGRRPEPYVAQGLSWIVTEALRLMRRDQKRPLVVNLSLGSLAGPGDETAFLASHIDYEVSRFQKFARAPMRVTAAYGNSRRARLVARQMVTVSKPLELEWRVQPDDRTSSFLELRAPADKVDRLSLSLTEPGEAAPSLHLKCWPLSNEKHTAPGAMVMGEQETVHRAVLIALGPTEPPEGGRGVRPGAWKVCVRSAIKDDMLVTARVQRDDTPVGSWTWGRQSWLDHAAERIWSDESRDWTDPHADDPVKYAGTAVAHAGAKAADLTAGDAQALFVGAARPLVGGPPGEVEVMAFSAEGAQGPLRRVPETEGPHLVARSEDGVMLPGRLVSGMTSGTVARYSGTSLAAPLVARRLAVALMRNGGTLDPQQQEAELFGAGVKGTTRHPHKGEGTLKP